MTTLTLTPPARTTKPTDIEIGSGVLASIAKRAKKHDAVVILFDEGIASVASAIPVSDAVRIPVKKGDTSKSLGEVDRIVTTMLDAGCGRSTLVVGIGGGMMTDLAGFVASVFMRGVPCILVPTTLLGMVDAAIGGKTAVNAGSRKNMIGTISHPSAVIVDTDLLKTLPAPQCSEGLAEIIKIAAILDEPFFEWLEEAMPKLLKRDPKTVHDCVVRAIKAKANVVESDDHDRDVRLLLNFGHTVGHAVEALGRYEISHGQCVSIGMSAEMAMCGFAEASRVEKLLVAAGLPLALPVTMSRAELWKTMQSDKKNEKGAVKVAVPKRLGEGAVRSIEETDFAALFTQ